MQFYLEIVEKLIAKDRDEQTNLLEEFQVVLYSKISITLLEEHKLLFRFLLTLKTLLVAGAITHNQVQLLKDVGKRGQLTPTAGCPKEMDAQVWQAVVELANRDSAFKGLPMQVRNDPGAWVDLQNA